MKKLIIPSKLNEGDTVAFISISGGRAGDEDMIPRYLLGKRRFEKIFHVKVVETPHALRGSGYLYEHPEKRAEDLMWALKNDSIKGIICNQGGDDSYRVLPYTHQVSRAVRSESGRWDRNTRGRLHTQKQPSR